MADTAVNTPLPIGTLFLDTPFSTIFPSIIGTALSSPSPLFSQIRLYWCIVDTLWEGTDAMRLAGRRFLPQEPLEEDENYQRRLIRTTLHNFYKRSIQSGVAKIFSKNPYLQDETNLVSKDPSIPNGTTPISTPITDFCNDVDTQGRDLGQFSKDLMEDSVNHGVSYLLVDYASVPQDFANLAEEQASGNRPYWVKIPATSVLDARSGKFADGERLAYFKFEEQVIELSSDFTSHSTFRQVRIYKQDPPQNQLIDSTGEVIQESQSESPVYFAVYRQECDGFPSTSGSWILQRWGTLSVNSIPVIPTYTNKIGFLLGKPPLMDLAELNIEHWQARSDYANILHVVNVPILFGKGIRTELNDTGGRSEIKIAPNSGVFTNSMESTLSYVEHTGASIGAARQNIQDLEARMNNLGLILTAQTSGAVTATAHAISSAEANAMLKSYALNLQQTLDSALNYTAQYMGISSTARCIVNTDYAVDYTNNQTMGDVLTAFNAGIIDKQTVITEGKRRNVFDPAATIVPPPVNQSLTPGGIPLSTDTSNDSVVDQGTENTDS